MPHLQDVSRLAWLKNVGRALTPRSWTEHYTLSIVQADVKTDDKWMCTFERSYRRNRRSYSRHHRCVDKREHPPPKRNQHVGTGWPWAYKSFNICTVKGFKFVVTGWGSAGSLTSSHLMYSKVFGPKSQIYGIWVRTRTVPYIDLLCHAALCTF